MRLFPWRRLGGGFLLVRGQREGQAAAAAPQDQQRNLGQAGDDHEHQKAGGDDQARSGLAKTCERISSPRLFLLLLRVTIRPAASETMNAGNLAHQAVADGQLGVELAGSRDQSQLFSTMPTYEAAENIDEGDDDAGDGVAADEFAGTVHGPVKIRLAGDVFAALRGPRLR